MYDKLKETIKNLDYISIKGGDSFVSHQEILNLVSASDIGLVSYRPDKSTENCIPTKIYEYLAHQLPYLISSNPLWLELTNKYKAGIETDFLKPDAESILKQIKENKFYTTSPGAEIYWEGDSALLLVLGA